MLLLFFCQLICAYGLYVVVYDRISRTNIRLVRNCWPPSVEFNKYTFLWMEATSVQSDQTLLLCRSYPTNCTHAHAITYTQTFSLFVYAFFFACLSPECVNIYHPNNSILPNCLICLFPPFINQRLLLCSFGMYSLRNCTYWFDLSTIN